MATGTAKWFSDAKGFGLLARHDRSKDPLVHPGAITGDGHRSPPQQVTLSHDTEQGDGGCRPVNAQAA
jgi:CspA family cold shock protein